jgi:3-carboxy-cis,cis-muconate cycloisomerase
VLARTLMQPAQVTSFGFKLTGWLAPLVRSRARLRECAARALQLQLGGAVGTLAVMGEKGPAVAERVANALNLKLADAAWHTQRDEWVRLGLEVAVLSGSLGKLATDLSLMAQGEVAELAEPSGNGRGGSSAMPHKRNPGVRDDRAGRRRPHAAARRGAAGEHEPAARTRPGQLAGRTGRMAESVPQRARRLAGAERRLCRIEDRRRAHAAQHRCVARPGVRGSGIGLPGRDHRQAAGAQPAGEGQRRRLVVTAPSGHVLAEAVQSNDKLRAKVDPAHLQSLFDPTAATAPAQRLAQRQLQSLRGDIASLNHALLNHK